MLHRTSATIAALGIAIVGIGSSSTHPEQLPGRVIDVNARDYFFEAPDTIDSGAVTLRLWQRGRDFHNLELVRVDSGRTLAEWHRAAIAHRLPSWAENLGGPGFAESGGSANATLLVEPGDYLLTCSVGSARTVDSLYHVWRGMVRPIHVRASKLSRELPKPDIIARITDHGVEFSGTMEDGSRLLRVENADTVVREFSVTRVLPGHTVAEALAWRPRMGPPAPDTLVGGLADLGPGRVLFTTITFRAGDHIAQTMPGAGHPGSQTAFVIRPRRAR